MTKAMCETVTSDVPAPGAASGRQPGLHTGHLAPLCRGTLFVPCQARGQRRAQGLSWPRTQRGHTGRGEHTGLSLRATGAPCSSVCHQSPGATASITFTPGFAGPRHSHALRMAPAIWAAPQIKTSVKSPKPECRDQQGVVILCLLSDEVWGHQVKPAEVCSPQQMRKNCFTKFVFKLLSAAWQRGYKKFTRI